MSDETEPITCDYLGRITIRFDEDNSTRLRHPYAAEWEELTQQLTDIRTAFNDELVKASKALNSAKSDKAKQTATEKISALDFRGMLRPWIDHVFEMLAEQPPPPPEKWPAWFVRDTSVVATITNYWEHVPKASGPTNQH